MVPDTPPIFNWNVSRCQPEDLAFAIGELRRSELGLALRFGQVGETFLLSLQAVVIGEGELRIDDAVDAIVAGVNLDRDVAALDFEGEFQVGTNFRLHGLKGVPKVSLKVKVSRKRPEKRGGSGGARTRNLCRDRAAL